jgi:transcriptional regulator with XRE-family HTH domain
MDEELDVDATYARQVGLRLRGVRRSQRQSLHDVEMASEKEFKASVLGAYERGERAISVPRLQRLARFYGVPVDHLLPVIDLTGDNAGEVLEVQERRGPARGITIDLVQLEALSSQEATLLSRYVATIRAQRTNAGGSAMTIRRDDLNTLAVLLETDAETVKGRMAALGAELVH